MVQQIHRLSEDLVNRIAAGEIVERPSSVVKELIENSIDAGAHRIDVSIRDGGRAGIMVTDDGCGMSKRDLELAVDCHTTSKVSVDGDLATISTLGFRGEALASIGSVSKMTVTSRVKGKSKEAWSVVVDCGRKGEITPASFPVGTRIEVTDLFHKTPARHKFLKSAYSECESIRDTIARQAMVRPEIAFSFSTDGRSPMMIPVSDLKGRLGHLLTDIFLENTLVVDVEKEAFHITGYIGLPTFNRNSSQYQYLFINRRWVRDKVLSSAIRAAYGDLLPHDRYPIVVLFWELPHRSLDVNVHPAKTEVRFRDSNLMREFTIICLRQVLAESGHLTSSTRSTATLKAMQPVDPGESIQTPTTKTSSFASDSPKGSSNRVSKRAARLTSEYSAPLTTPTSSSTEKPSVQSQDVHEIPTKKQQTSSVPRADGQTGQNGQTEQTVQEEELQDEDVSFDMERYPLGYARSQIHRSYIIAQTKEGLIIVDQHAAHERILYERMKAGLAESKLESQGLLLPSVIALSESDMSMLLGEREVLEGLGFDVEPFGVGCVVVQGIPSLLGKANVQEMVVDIVDTLKEHGDLSGVQEKLDKICASIACHGAIRAGHVLSLKEMNALLRQIETTPYTGQCNHGRPTYIVLKLMDIERLFERR